VCPEGSKRESPTEKELSKMHKSQAEEGQMTYLEVHQPQLVLEMFVLVACILIEEANGQ
jgi:hypothetical protein